MGHTTLLVWTLPLHVYPRRAPSGDGETNTPTNITLTHSPDPTSSSRQCQECCRSSDSEISPVPPKDDRERITLCTSRSGRKIHPPKPMCMEYTPLNAVSQCVWRSTLPPQCYKPVYGVPPSPPPPMLYGVL